MRSSLFTKKSIGMKHHTYIFLHKHCVLRRCLWAAQIWIVIDINGMVYIVMKGHGIRLKVQLVIDSTEGVENRPLNIKQSLLREKETGGTSVIIKERR